MHRLEDEASELTRRVGCVQCVLGGGGSTPVEDNKGTSACNMDPEIIEQYSRRYLPNTWVDAELQYARKHLNSNMSTSASLKEPDVFSSLSRSRARGAMLGGAVADAAAMGVHWVYDLELLEALQAERMAQVGPGVEEEER